MAEMATRAGLILAILITLSPAASPADPPPFRFDDNLVAATGDRKAI